MSGATQNIETKVDELGTLTRQFMMKVDEQSTATKARAAEIEETLRKIDARINEVETKASRPLIIPGNTEDVKRIDEISAKAFDLYMRKGVEAVMQAGPEFAKSLATDKDTDGGYLVPRNVSNKIIELLVEFSPIRSYAGRESISTGDSFEYPLEGSTVFAQGKHGERQTPSETATGTLGMGKVPTHYQYAEPRATQKMLDDSATNVEAWISKKVGEQFGKEEGQWFVSGTGVGEPEGIITNANVSLVEGAASGTITHEDMLDLLAALPEAYAKRAALFMRRATRFYLRKIRDLSGGAGTGQFMWQPSIQVGGNPTYDGAEVVETPDLAAVAASAKPIIYGDLREGYLIVDRQGVVQIRDPLTAKPFIKFYTTRRVGGQVVKPEAIRIFKVKA